MQVEISRVFLNIIAETILVVILRNMLPKFQVIFLNFCNNYFALASYNKKNLFW